MPAAAKMSFSSFRFVSAMFTTRNVSKNILSFLLCKSCKRFFASAITTLQTLVIALGAGLGVWGVVNLLEGYGSDNPGAKSQGMKQLMAGGGIIVLGTTLIPLLSTLF